MQTDVLSELARLGFPFPITGADHEEDPDTKETSEDDTENKVEREKTRKVEFTDEQAAEARRLSQKAAREADEKARKEERERIETERKQADEEEQRKKAVEAGKFDEVKTELEQKVTDAESRLTTEKARADAFEKIVRDDVEASWSKLPEEVRELYDGNEDDVLAKKQHMTRSAKLVERLTGEKKSVRGNGFNPRSTENKSTTDEDTRAKAATRPNF